MPFPFNIKKQLRDLLFGSPFGELIPPRAPVPAATQQEDGRTAALRTLKEYVTQLVFYLPMGEVTPYGVTGTPAAFQIRPENFHIDWPDAIDDLKFPAAVVMPSRAVYDPIGLVAYVEEETRDVYAPGTVLQWQAEYQEVINLELWASKMPELRSMVAGIETAISPTEQMSGIRFRMPRYFNELVCFTLNRRENYGEADAARGARRLQLELQMRFNIVALVNADPFRPEVYVNVDYDADTGQRFVLVPDPAIPPPQPQLSYPADPAQTEGAVPPDASDLPAPRYPLPPNWTQ